MPMEMLAHLHVINNKYSIFVLLDFIAAFGYNVDSGHSTWGTESIFTKPLARVKMYI